MDTQSALIPRLQAHLEAIYPLADADALIRRILQIMNLPAKAPQPKQFANHWGPEDVWLITYGDSITAPDEPPLRSLKSLLDDHLGEDINGVHVLPFFPFTSDDGFAVSDYRAVRAELGDWSDLRALAGRRRLMADLVINHCSSAHPWFQAFCADDPAAADYFVSMDPGADLRAVVRPRTSPLLRPTETARGMEYVWCTFSHDQVDLNFRNPEVLLEFLAILRHYLDQGVRIFRLDAVAFLWKEEGSPSLNLPQTHEIVRLLRTVIEHVDDDALIITETNIPNRENLSYFGNGNEAHLVYNFSLPPLLLFTLWTGDCGYLKNWLMSMPPAQNGTTYLNFIASHDGIGLRPAEGLLSDEEIQAMVDTALDFGGQVSWRSLDHGAQRPYEMNIALCSALQGTTSGPDEHQLERFVCAHAIMLALEGIPAFYIHSLLATENDLAGMARTGQARSINRHQWQRDALAAVLADPDSRTARTLAALRRLIRLRAGQPAFHPNAVQFTLHLGAEIFAFWRQSQDRRQSIFVLNNISRQAREISLSELNLIITDEWQDLISGQRFHSLSDTVTLQPYQSMWISNRLPGAK